MKNHRVEYSSDRMCACFDVSRSSGYSAWLQRKPSQCAGQRQQLANRVKVLFEQHQYRYGAKRIQQQIQQDDPQHCNLKKAKHPVRWSGYTRNWTPIAAVTLNPDQPVREKVRNAV